MKKLTQEQIDKDISEHEKWRRGKGGNRIDWSGCNLSEANLSGANLSRANLSEANLSGANLSRANPSGANLYGANLSRANLSGANLSRANLYGANLSRANLSRANLSEANLSGANLSLVEGIIRASCSWTDHGERGRQLLAVRIDGRDVYFCGCLNGSLDDLREYIKRGDRKHAASRRIAAYFVSARMAEMKDAK